MRAESMTSDAELVQDFSHLAKLALTGRAQDVQLYLVRMARKYRKELPEFAQQLNALVQEGPTRQSPLRSETVAAIPVDADSRLQLLRTEATPHLDHEPIWSGEVKTQLEQIVREHRNASILLDAKLSPTRTALFTGPPGVGKTLAARWTARELGRPLLTLDLSAVISSYLGRTGANIRNVLDYAKGASCVLLIDEIDAVAKRRDDGQEVGELKRLVTVLLQEVDDWPAGGLLLAATNHPELLDPAVWRRFESQVQFPMPSNEAVVRAVSVLLLEEQVPADWMMILSEVFKGHSFSDIESGLIWVRRMAVIEGAPLQALLPRLTRKLLDSADLATRKAVARRLTCLNLSQRQVNEATGLSRDTIRKFNPELLDESEG
jgi:SpoVK/Ycf46/Vps4 family AAA+-type ATPase